MRYISTKITLPSTSYNGAYYYFNFALPLKMKVGNILIGNRE